MNMTIDEWMREEGLSNSEVAKSLGVARTTIYRARAGITQLSLDTFAELVELSKNKVTLQSYRSGGEGRGARQG